MALLDWYQTRMKTTVDKWVENYNLNELKVPTWFWPTFFAFLFSRLVVLFAAYFGEIMIRTGSEQQFYHINPDNVFIDVMARWDSGFYVSIVEKGYMLIFGYISNVAFFPLYPLLTSFVNTVVGNTTLSGVIVSHVSFFFALSYLYRLTEQLCDTPTAKRTIFYISVFPTALFFSAVYTESLFLLVTVAAAYYAYQQQWEFATIFALLASVTRITGVLIWGVVVLLWLNHHGWYLSAIYKAETWKNLWEGIKKDWYSLVFMCLAPLGVLSHMWFLNQQFEDPLAFWTVQAAFNRENLGPIGIIVRDFGPVLQQNFWKGEIWTNVFLDTITVFFALATTPFIYKRFGEAFTLYILLSLLIPLSSGTGSMTRYVLVLFPVFMMLGVWGKREPVDRFFQTLFPIFLGIFTAVFVNWIFLA